MPTLTGLVNYLREIADRNADTMADEKLRKPRAERQLAELRLSRERKDSLDAQAVLPTLTGQSYDELVIQDGISAGAEFYRVHYGEASESERARVRENLLRYCALDTLAMHLYM